MGNGYRWSLPSLMRFNAPDDLSPFGAGGINSYAYCGCDPINRVDPSGHAFEMLEQVVARMSSYTGNLYAPRPGRGCPKIIAGAYVR